MSTYLPKANIILTTVCTSGVFGLMYINIENKILLVHQD